MQLPVFAVFEKETNEVDTSYYCKTGRIYHPEQTFETRLTIRIRILYIASNSKGPVPVRS